MQSVIPSAYLFRLRLRYCDSREVGVRVDVAPELDVAEAVVERVSAALPKIAFSRCDIPFVSLKDFARGPTVRVPPFVFPAFEEFRVFRETRDDARFRLREVRVEENVTWLRDDTLPHPVQQIAGSFG